ncbi:MULTISPECIES: porin [unclassified Pandoraea]|uniref:porin n=1 Tax=unclassified Pandoraea TaxID=2624094 RepID=UPI000B3F83C2|nr:MULTISPECIES: porin [unclassified Pandoraea]
MKKRSIAAGALLTFSGYAAAQSQVTIYGILDNGVNYTTNQGGSHNVQVAGGALNGNRWGLRGTEDLGGGLQAIFRLENGFDITNGKLANNSREFGRQAFVGLSGDFGSVTIGRHYDSLGTFLGPLASSNKLVGFMSSHPGDADNVDSTARVNNSVRFNSADYKGFTFGGVYSFGGVAGSYRTNQIYSLGASYLRGPLHLGFGYLNAQNPLTSMYDGSMTSPVTSGYSNAKSLQVIGAGGSYQLGPVKLGLLYTNTQFKDVSFSSTTPFRGTAKMNNYELNAQYTWSPAVVISGAYTYTRAENARYQQLSAVYDYFLSKRTDVYALAIYQRATGRDSTAGPAVAQIYGVAASSSNGQGLLRVGVRHRF